MSEEFDVAIIGGGPVGSALASYLKGSALSVAVLEARSSPSSDPRSLAMSEGSRLILERLGAWQKIEKKTPIETIHVSQKGSFGRAVLTSTDSGVPALGYVASYPELHRALLSTLDAENISYLAGACAVEIDTMEDCGRVDFDYLGQRRQLSAKLLVMAEGGRLIEHVREIEQHQKDYGQWAIIAQVETEKPHRNTAYERFTPNGPLALLPYEEGFSLVWTSHPEEAKRLLDLDAPEFLKELHGHFGDRLGDFTSVANRAAFPLMLKYASPNASQRLALIGNAAQTLHPVAGQGFNLGLRDARALGKVILDSKPGDIGSEAMLSKYKKSRELDREGGMRFTDSLIRIFANENASLASGRGLALAALDSLPLARKWFSRKMMFGMKPSIL